jgi:integrase
MSKNKTIKYTGKGTIFLRGKTYYYENKPAGITMKSLKTADQLDAVTKAKLRFGYLDFSDQKDQQEELLFKYEKTKKIIEDNNRKKIPLKNVLEEYENILILAQKSGSKHIDADNLIPLAPATIKTARIIFNNFQKWIHNNYSNIETFNQISPEITQNYFISLKKSGKKASTFNRYLVQLNVIWKRLSVNLGEKQNPFSVIPKIKTNALKEDTSSKRPFTHKEISTMLIKAKEWLRPAIFIGYYSGLRLSDVITLKWKELDLQEGFIIRKMRKTSKQQILYIPEIIAELSDWKNLSNSNNEYVFQAQAETYLGLRNYLPSARSKNRNIKKKPDTTKASKQFQRFLNDICKFDTKNEVGQTILGFHSLRVSNATYGKNSGETEEVIQSRLGHSTSKITAIYIQQNIEEKKRELKSSHVSLPISFTDSNFDSLKITELKNKILNIQADTYEKFTKGILSLLKSNHHQTTN